MVKFIKDLGMLHLTEKSSRKTRGALVECPLCTAQFTIAYTRRKKTKTCKHCKGRLGSPAVAGKKKCSTCKVVKETAEFYLRKDSTDGFRSQCKLCVSTSARYRWKDNTEFKNKGLERSRVWLLKSKYNITIDGYNKLFKKQGGVCAICEKTAEEVSKNFLVVDHDHQTGKVRGLLCGNCNSGIGLLGDTLTSIKNAVTYLERVEANEA